MLFRNTLSGNIVSALNEDTIALMKKSPIYEPVAILPQPQSAPENGPDPDPGSNPDPKPDPDPGSEKAPEKEPEKAEKKSAKSKRTQQ